MFEFILNGIFKDFSLMKEGVVSILNSPNEIRIFAQKWVNKCYIKYEIANYLKEKGFEKYVHITYYTNHDYNIYTAPGEVIAGIRLSHEGISKCQELETLFKLERI